MCFYVRVCFSPDHAQSHRCLVGSVGIARGNVDVHTRVLHWRGIVLQVSVAVHTKNTFVFVVGPLVLGYIPLTRKTTNQSAPFPTPPPESCPAIHAPFLADVWLAVRFDFSFAIFVFGAQVV